MQSSLRENSLTHNMPKSKATRDTYEFILRAVKCDTDDDLVEFMEEVDDEQ